LASENVSVSGSNGVSPRFIQGLQSNIAYWQQKTAHLFDADVPELDSDFPNLLRAVQMGIVHVATRIETAVLVTQVFFWVEQAGHWGSWLPVLDRLTHMLDDNVLRCQLFKQQGQLYRSSQQLDAAVPVLTKSAELARQLNDDLALAEAKTHLSSIYLQKRAYAEAESLGQEALHLLTHIAGAERQVTAVLTNLGLISLAQGAFDQAEAQLTEAAEMGRDVQQPTQLARILNSLAIARHRQGKLEASQHAYEEAITIIEQTASRIDKVRLRLSFGSLYVDMNRLDEAEQLFLQAEQTLQTVPGHLPYRAMIANNLGNVLLEKEQPASAERYLRRSVELRQQLNIRLPLANSYKSWGQALYQLGQIDEALAAVDAALQILPDFADDVWAKELMQECATLRDTFYTE